MTDNLFDENDPVQVDPNKDYLNELIGENGKFHKADREEALKALARGKVEADAYIPVLEKRLDDLRADYLKIRDENVSRARLEDLIEQLSASKQLASSEENQNANEVNTKPVIDPNEIKNIFSSQIREYENTKKEQENANLVRNKLQERFGSNYKSVLKEQVETLGLTEDFVNDLARKHPKLLFKTLGVDENNQQENFQAPPRSSQQRTDSFAPKTEKRTWSYYEKMRKENPKQYYDPKIAVQLHRDAIDLGDAFKDGNWRQLN